ncbi:hypothetical protein R3P38DRAFT_2584034 [Favolaschia claudopus]|uniref:F-box domain-containing protein n=1 Tax=Favolaschia claudopus TaxID=2862362 RepID=A0AAV9Z8B4_9AGAR
MTSEIDALADLEAQLRNVQADIDRHETLLCDLRRTKGQIQRRINNYRDPMARLPLEISSKILHSCLPLREKAYSSLSDPLQFLNICTLWTEIALGTPELWTNLTATIPSEITPDFLEYFDTWLKRGQDTPLYLALSGPGNSDFQLLHTLTARAHHLRELEIESPRYLELFALGTEFPALRTIWVLDNHPKDGLPLQADAVLKVFQSAPHLESFGFLKSPGQYSIRITESLIHMVHTRLTKLDILALKYDGARLLEWLTLPSLTHLGILVRDTDAKHEQILLSFLKRSSPPLEHFVLSVFELNNGWSRETIIALLDLLPSVRTLEVLDGEHCQDILISILRENPVELCLPKLTSLSIKHPGFWPAAEWFSPLIAMLYARRQQLASFTLSTAYGSPTQIHELSHEDYRAVGVLVEEGMRVDLGRVRSPLETEEETELAHATWRGIQLDSEGSMDCRLVTSLLRGADTCGEHVGRSRLVTLGTSQRVVAEFEIFERARSIRSFSLKNVAFKLK